MMEEDWTGVGGCATLCVQEVGGRRGRQVAADVKREAWCIVGLFVATRVTGLALNVLKRLRRGRRMDL